MRQPRYLGVYSERPNAGAEARGRSGRRPRFFVWELSPADYAIQELDGALEPNSRVRLISAGRLQSGYQLEPSILVAPITLPDIANAERVPETPETAAPRKAAELNDDTLRELEIARRAKQIENDLRGSFRKAIRGLSRPREREAALEALAQIAETIDGIVPAHKHMFRDFGVTLRKKDLPEIALRCGLRVLELSPDDDHGHFNLARILCALGVWDKAAAHVERAMRLDGAEPVYPRLLAHIRKESRRPGRTAAPDKQ
ncbi:MULTISPECIES: tetratricopeptide repeat protein [unclassified Desulfovibrio]|uniref:tetratricopeptide repeat protein n=1 Tax=unclassified Desulfovibrio TaxID=2593640 RepID=UPI0013EB2262|nr:MULTISPECIES: tetratricopeptide repeat protein [unclassified Desulfovibrio]